MSVSHRRMLVIFFALVFLIAAPFTVFYASGYRYNTRLGKIEQVGLLYVTTDEKDSKLDVGGQSYPMNRERIIRLAPQRYQITLSKDGYHTWQKNLELFEGQTTFALDIDLFANQQPQPFELFVKQLELLADDQSLAMYRTDDYLILYHKASKKIDEFALPTKEPLTEIRLDGVNGQAVFLQGNSWFLATATGIKNLDAQLPTGTQHVKPMSDGLLAMTLDHVWEVSAAGEQTNVLSQPLAQDITQQSGQAWILAAEASKRRTFVLETPSLNSRARFLLALPYSDDMIIADQYHGFLTIDDRRNHQIHLVDTKVTPPLVTTLAGVHDWAWSADHNQLLTATDFEVTIQHIDHGRKQELIVRLSTPITDIAWEPSYERQVFYVNDGVIYVAERDDRDQRNIVALTPQQTAPHLLSVSTDNELQYSSSRDTSYVFWNLGL